MQLFFAIRIPQDSWNSLQLVQERLPKISKVRYSMASDFHIILKFLGECDSMKALEASVNARSALKRIHFNPGDTELSFSRLSTFNKHHIPQVIWSGVKMSEVLYGFQQDLEAAMEPLGFEGEGKRFRPHVVLARVREFKNHENLEEWTGAFNHLGIQRKPFNVESFELIESVTEEGLPPEYKTVETFLFS